MELRLHRHAEVDSTNERALAAVAAGTACHGDVHVATGQSAGRGRLGRGWSSPSGKGLYLSLVLLPVSPPRLPALTMAAGLAVLAAVRALGADAHLKWPNDLMARENGVPAKLAGILVEARGFDPARPHAVVGLGLNVRQREFPPELRASRAVTSLRRLGLELAVEDALEAVLATLAVEMERALTHPSEVAADFGRTTGWIGGVVRIRHGSGEERGRLITLTLDGLELRGEDGRTRRIALEHAQALEPEG